MATRTLEAVDVKAFRLRGQVTWLSAAVAQVEGDHGAYLVDRLGADWQCNCPWGHHRTAGQKPCSHVLAAALAAPAITVAPARESSGPVASVAPATATSPPAPRPLPARSAPSNTCLCQYVHRADLYYNAHQASVIHRGCGKPWSAPAITTEALSC